MKHYIFSALLFSLGCVAMLSVGNVAFAQAVPQIETNPATNVQGNSATLNGEMLYLGGPNATVWFQWGTSTAYGSQGIQFIETSTAAFNQNISGLTANTTYHFRAVSQNSYGTTYGNDMTFTTNSTGTGSSQIVVSAGNTLYLSSGQTAVLQGSGYDTLGNTVNYAWSCTGGTLSSYNIAQPTYTAPIITGPVTYSCTLTVSNSSGASNSASTTVYVNSNNTTGNGVLTVTKSVINVTSGNLNWQSSVNATAGNIVSFAVTLQPGSQDIHNVYLRDILPANLIYRGNLTMNTTNYSGDITAGINIGTVYANQPVIISYQAQVSPYLPYGSMVLTNNVTVTSTEAGTETASSSVLASNATAVYGATYVSTGLTNGFLTDSFFLPLLLIITGLYLYFSGNVYKFADWLKRKI